MYLTSITLLGFLASSSLAIPSPASPFGSHSARPKNTATPSPTGDISIPLASILAAPIVEITAENTTFVPVSGGSNTTLVNARPDLQTYVDNALQNTTKHPKRSLEKRVPHGEFCALPSTGPSLTSATWTALASLICQKWYPTPGTVLWDPSSPYPNTLKHSSLKIGLGGGSVVALDFQYGVNDWGTQAGYGWSPYYVPQSQSICIADLGTLVLEMFGNCLPHSGYDTSGIKSDGNTLPVEFFDGTGQPKWYAFKAS